MPSERRDVPRSESIYNPRHRRRNPGGLPVLHFICSRSPPGPERFFIGAPGRDLRACRVSSGPLPWLRYALDKPVAAPARRDMSSPTASAPHRRCNASRARPKSCHNKTVIPLSREYLCLLLLFAFAMMKIGLLTEQARVHPQSSMRPPPAPPSPSPLVGASCAVAEVKHRGIKTVPYSQVLSRKKSSRRPVLHEVGLRVVRERVKNYSVRWVQ